MPNGALSSIDSVKKKIYNIRNKYMNAAQIFIDLSFQVKRFYNQRGIINFKLKSAKSRSLTYFSNQNLEFTFI